ncbi:MAG: HlyD family efflux transporter periplasmic adaptor subunit [Bacteroidales bacterium]|nr:HlyD family efflux transporter periplasmic adaptor subunit [Bacteroidales bacterium]
MKKIYFLVLILFSACSSNDKNFDATGFFETTEVTVSAEANGRITSLNISEGYELNKNQSVGAIDSIQLYLNKLQLEASMKSVTSSKPDISKQIAVLNEQIAKQKTEKKRIENLLKDNAATTKQLDDINSVIKVLENQLSATQSTLNKNFSSLDAQSSALDIQIAQINDRLEKCRIISPINGTVLNKYAQEGELANIGKPLFKLGDTKNMFLRAYVTSGQLAGIKTGDKVKVTADFGGDKQREYEGIVTWISSKSEFTPKTIQTKNERENLVYAVKIAVENDGYIKIGMYGEVIFK